MNTIEITFNNLNYKFNNNTNDKSFNGCINEIIKNNEYSLDKFINMTTTIIDIGANCGIASIILAKQNPDSKIISFEPDINVFKELEKNIELNDVQNIIIYNMAVSKISNKILKLNLHPYYSGGNTTCSNNVEFNNFFDTNCNSIDILTKSLDDIIIEHNIDSIGLLKIDCEGAEYEILFNSLEFKKNIVKNLVGEFHDLEYNINSTNNPYDLYDYCKNYVSGFIKITVLKIKNKIHKQHILVNNN